MANILSKKRSKRASSIHPTAIVSPEAWLDEGVEIGPYTIIGPQVKIGRETKIAARVLIEGDTEIGQRCRIFSGAVIGSLAQTLQTKPARSGLSIGDDNVLREYVTVNASMKDGCKTMIGDRNMLMTGAHVAHDCALGSNIVMANLATLAGHVTIEDQAVIGGMTGVHQFVRIGRLAMVGALSKVVMDIPPFSIVDGRPGRFRGPNAIGLKRAGFTAGRRIEIKKAQTLLFGKRCNFSEVIPQVRRRFKDNPDVEAILSFVERSKRGVSRSTVSDDVE